MRVPAFSPALLPALPVGLFTRGQLPASLLPCLCSCPFLPKHDGHTSAGCRGCSLQDPRGKRPAYRSGVLDLNSGFMSSRLPACRGTPPLPCSAAASWRRGSDPAPRGCSGEAQNPYLVQEAARIQSGPRGTLLFPTAFLPQPRGPRGPWGMGAEAASFPRPEEGQRLWAGPVVCTACQSLSSLPHGSGLGARAGPEGRGRGRQSGGFRRWPRIAPCKSTLPLCYRHQALQASPCFQILQGARLPQTLCMEFSWDPHLHPFCTCCPSLFRPLPDSGQSGPQQ